MFVYPRPKKSLLPPPSKRRKITSSIEEINFDFGARADYLTGFHKRKVQRTKQAQTEALKKAREERIIQRKQLREERRKELEDHIEAVNTLLKDAKVPGFSDGPGSQDDSWDGIQDELPIEPVDHEEEYIDEDRYTTVTVEAVDITKEGIHKIAEHNDEEEEDKAGAEEGDRVSEVKTAKKTWPKKPRKQKFRYESKAERKFTREKQKAGNKAKADTRRGNG